MSFTDSEIWAYANTILGAPQDVIDDLIASECDIADAEADEELGPEEVASLEAALAEPDFGPFTTEQLASMVDGWQAWQELQNVPPYVEREANQKEV